VNHPQTGGRQAVQREGERKRYHPEEPGG
jgi:hypothetical protein